MFLSRVVSPEKSTRELPSPLQIMCCCSLTNLNFFLCFWFFKMHLWHAFISVDFSNLKFAVLLESICRFMSFSNLGSFQYCFLSVSHLAPHCLLWNSACMNFRCHCSTSPWATATFLDYFPLIQVQ